MASDPITRDPDGMQNVKVHVNGLGFFFPTYLFCFGCGLRLNVDKSLIVRSMLLVLQNIFSFRRVFRLKRLHHCSSLGSVNAQLEQKETHLI